MTRDLTEGNPAKLILFFTIPLLIGNLFQQLYSMADTFIVGRTLGLDALAAVGSTGSITFLIIGFAQGITAGFSIVTSQRFGAGDVKGVRKSFATSIILCIFITIILTVGSIIFARPILNLMQTPDKIIDNAYFYIVVIYSGIAASMMFNLLSNMLRALGDSRTPLVFLVIACAINIGLDFLFILVFKMGVAGAAFATVVSQLLSGFLCIIFIAKSFPMLHVYKEDLKITGSDIWSHLKVGLPMGFQSSIIAIGGIILQFALNQLGSEFIASYTTAQKVDMLATLPMMSFGMTMATYTGQNFGAGKIDRIKKGVWQCAAISISFSIVMGLINIFAGRYIAGFFILDEADTALVMNNAGIYLTINGSLYFILALLFIFRYTLQGLGKNFVPTFAGIMELCMRSFAAIILANYFGFTGACAANPLAWLGSCVPLSIAFFVTMHKMMKNFKTNSENKVCSDCSAPLNE